MREPEEPTKHKERCTLECALTQTEFNERAASFAELDAKLDALETSRKEANDDYKDQIGGVNARRSALRRVVLNRSEPRLVDCTWHADWASKSMLLRRDDTGEPVGPMRVMTPDEVQQSLDLTLPDRDSDHSTS